MLGRAFGFKDNRVGMLLNVYPSIDKNSIIEGSAGHICGTVVP